MKRFLICLFVLAVALASCSAFAATKEFVINPSFEDGAAPAAAPWYNQAAWGACTGQAVTTQAHTGTRSWETLGAAAGATNCVEQIVPLISGGLTYSVSYWVKIPSASPTTPAKVDIRAWFGTPANLYISGFWSVGGGSGITITTSDWVQVTDGVGGWIPAPECNQVVLRCRVTSNDPTMVAYIDDASVTAAAHNLTGKVVDTLGNPMAGVKVYAGTSNPPMTTVPSATTAADGTYTVGVPDGVETYVMASPGGLYGDSAVETVAAGTTDVVVPDLVVTKLATVKFTGKVVDAATKVGLAGVTVAANIADGLALNTAPFVTTTGNDGTYELEVLDDLVNPIGTFEYYISAGKFPYTPNPSPSQYVDISVGSSPYVLQDIELSRIMPLVDINAGTLTNGAVTSWPNTGSLGGNFIPWSSGTPLVSVVGSVKAVKFTATPMNLVDSTGTACITAPPSIVGTVATDKPVFTLATWIYRATLPNDQNDAGYCSWGPFYYGANYQYSGAGWAADHFGSGNIGYNNIATAAPAGKWHHIVVTSDGTTERIFIDGAQNSTANAPTAFLNTEVKRLGAANPIVVGAIENNDAWNFWTERAFAGSIQSLQIYNVAMSEADVASIYASSTPPTATSNTVSGKVVDGSAAPMNGVMVTLSYGGKQIASCITGSNGLGAGEYKFDVLPDNYQLNASAPLYVKTPAGAINVDASAGNVAVADIVLVYRQPVALVDISADDPSVAAGSLAAWPNNGSIGGSFKPVNGATSIGVVDGFKAAVFSGNNNLMLKNTANAYINLPAENTGNAKWTVSSWVRQAATGWQVYYSWAPHGDGQGPDNGAASMCWVNDGGQGAFRNRGAGNLGWLNNTIPTTGVWHNLTFTYDGAVLSAYVDGVLNNSKTLSLPMAIPSGKPLIVGSRYWNADGTGPGDYFNGAVARVVMLDDALPAANIATFAQSIKPVQRYYITINVTDGTNPIQNALVRYAGSAVAITGADGIAKFGIPTSGQTFEIYADAAGYNASFQKVATPASGDMTYTVNLVANPSEPAVSDTFNTDLGHWEAFTEFGTERPQGGNDAIGNPWPAPTPGMYTIAAIGGEASFQYTQHEIAPGLTYPGGDPAAITNGSGTITGISSNTLEDSTKAWGANLGGTFDQWGRALQMTVNGKMKRYPIVANTATSITVDAGYDLVADGLTVGTTYKIVDSVFRWWYPGGIKLTNPLPVTPGSVYNFYYKQKTTGNTSQGRWQLIFTDDAGAVKGTLQVNGYDPNTGGVYKQFIPAVQYVAPAGATKVMARIGTVENNNLSEYHTRTGSFVWDDIVIDPVVLPTISGIVTTADGVTPISGASVVISGAAGNIQLTTAADGSYSSIVSPNDTYTVTATKIGFVTGSIQVVVGTESSANNNIALQVPPPQMVSGKVTDQATGVGIEGATVFFSYFANASASPVYTATTDANGDYSIQIPGGTWYVCAVANNYAPSADLSPALSLGSTPVSGVNFALTENGRKLPAADKLIFAAFSDSFTAADGAATGNWNTYMPKGSSLATMGTPTVQVIENIKWEKNIYGENDGYRFGDVYTSPIPANGASAIVVVKPTRNTTSTSWTSVVDVFYSKLILGIRNNNGKIVVNRNGKMNDGPEIPDGQSTILSLVVQPTGEYKVWANGIEVMSETSTSDMTSLIPGSAGHEKYINVGRNNPDGWTVFNGNIGDVYLYRTALVDADREAIQVDLANRFNIHVPVFTTVSGKVTLDDGVTPVQGATITSIGNVMTTTTTDADGKYQLSVEADSYVSISAAKDSFLIVYPAEGQYDLNVTATPVENLDFRMTPINTITGVVKDANDKPINNAVVQIGGIGGPGALTGPDGKYMISGITPGYGTEIYADALGYANNTQTVDTTPAATGPLAIDITLTAKNELGVVKNAGFEQVTNGVPDDWRLIWLRTASDWAICYDNPVPGNTDVFSATSDCVTGTYAAKYASTSVWTFVTQEIKIIPNSTYNFYMKLKGEAGIPNIFPMFAFRNDANEELAGYVSAEDAPYNGWAFAPPTTWKTFFNWNTYGNGLAKVPSLRLTPPAGATKVTVWIGFVDSAAGKALYADDVIVDRVGPDTPPVTEVTSVKDLKAQPEGTYVKLVGSVTVTLAPTAEGVFYVGEANRISGLRVVKSGAVLNAGDTVTDLTGTVKKTAGGEIYVELEAVPTGTAGTKIAPLAMNNKAAAEDKKALSNLVKVWGLVTVSGSNFTISDGYSAPITVLTNGATLPTGFDGSTATITGVVSRDDAGKAVILLGSF